MASDLEQFQHWLRVLAAWQYPNPLPAELEEPCSLCPYEEACLAADQCLKNL